MIDLYALIPEEWRDTVAVVILCIVVVLFAAFLAAYNVAKEADERKKL